LSVLGKLKLLSLPIGNLGDLTQRAKEELILAKEVLAEDTRVFRSLLSKLEISSEGKNIVAFHDHTQDEVSKYVERLKNSDILMVSDAGSPVVSDPAYPLIKAAIGAGFELDTIPGVSSVICALELSGLPPHPFMFSGFLPREKEKRAEKFSELMGGVTTLFFESPHRIEETLEILAKASPECDVALCRELTKLHQSVYRFKAKDFSKIKDSIVQKGEMVLALYTGSEGAVKKSGTLKELEELAQEIVTNGASPKPLSKLLAKILDRNAKEIYQELLNSKKS
jgi:16S rRNA (cytidine1402-2'-O)-methyltransferase